MGAERERLRKQGRGPGVVGHHERARPPGGVGHRGDVGDLQPGVGRRLDPHQVRGGLQRGGDRGGIGEIDELRRHAPAGVDRFHERAGPVVNVVGKYHTGAGAEALEDRRGGGLAGGEGHGLRAAFERRERLLQRLAIGIVEPGVNVALPQRAVGRALEGRAQDDGGGDRTGDGVDRTTGMDGEGFRTRGLGGNPGHPTTLQLRRWIDEGGVGPRKTGGS